MLQGIRKSKVGGAAGPHFLLGSPRDRDELLQLFSLVVEVADAAAREGKQFGIPFAALVKLAHSPAPTIEQLTQFSRAATPETAHPPRGWPGCFQHPLPSTQAMLVPLLQFALEAAEQFSLDGPEICRVLAAVGQTLHAQNRDYRRTNRSLADRHRNAAWRCMGTAETRLLPTRSPEQELPSSAAILSAEQPVLQAPPLSSQVIVTHDPPWQVDLQKINEQAGCLRLGGLVLWHASYIGPRLAGKLENQDVTCAMTTPTMASPPFLVFALADGVTTSLGARLAAATIVRRFCELTLQQVSRGAALTSSDLIEAARQTQVSLNGLLKSLLQEENPHAFASMLGSEVTRKVALRVLQNTLAPTVAAMPAALNATLIGGIVQPGESPGSFEVELLRIGDGTVEHIDAGGKATSVLSTDPDEMTISEALGPGPQSAALFERIESFSTSRVLIAPGETLVISSDGLARGHDHLISDKLAELLEKPVCRTVDPDQADAALHLLHRASQAADDAFARNAEHNLFADNLSLILVRAGD